MDKVSKQATSKYQRPLVLLGRCMNRSSRLKLIEVRHMRVAELLWLFFVFLQQSGMFRYTFVGF